MKGYRLRLRVKSTKRLVRQSRLRAKTKTSLRTSETPKARQKYAQCCYKLKASETKAKLNLLIYKN